MKYAMMMASLVAAALGCGDGSSGDASAAPATETLWSAPALTAAPQGLSAVEDEGRVLLSWADLPDERAYRVERSTDGGESWTELAWVEANVPGYTDWTAPASDAVYRVRGWNGVLNGSPSAAARVIRPAEGFQRSALPGYGLDNDLALTQDGAAVVATRDAQGRLSLVNGFGAMDPGLGAAGPASLAVDASGTLVLAFYDESSRELVLAGGNAGGWTTSSLFPAYGGAEKPVLRISPADGSRNVLSLVSDGTGARSLVWARSDGSSLTTETIVSDSRLSAFAFAMDPQGVRHLVYAAGPLLVYARRLGSDGWTAETLPSTGTPSELALAADGLGLVNVVYRDATGEGLYRVGNENGSWENESLYAPAGRTPSVAMEALDGLLHVAYYDESSGDLVYARKGLGAAWETYLLDAAGDTGIAPALAVRDGVVRVAYRDAGESTLKLAVGAP